MLNNEDTVSVINNLIEVSKDGEAGFLKSAQDVTNEQLTSFFLRRSDEVKQSVLELQNLVRELGGEPADSTSIAGYLHRRWVDLKTAIVDNNELAVLNEVERGEDVALEAYRSALEKDLPTKAMLIVMRQLTGAQRNHDVVKEMRDALKATS